MENFIESITEFVSNYKTYILWLATISLFVFIFSLVSIKWLVALIPTDYFVKKNISKSKKSYSLLWLMSIIVKNIIGYTLILGGILMLVLPGQGLFTILMGLILSNYPGKYTIEKRIISIPSILKTINWLRKKSNKPRLKI
ncbi:MAG: PGPGW domain-containing protein [Gammaproteobacteria bacterium]